VIPEKITGQFIDRLQLAIPLMSQEEAPAGTRIASTVCLVATPVRSSIRGGSLGEGVCEFKAVAVPVPATVSRVAVFSDFSARYICTSGSVTSPTSSSVLLSFQGGEPGSLGYQNLFPLKLL
jgi:hypothetical protein